MPRLGFGVCWCSAAPDGIWRGLHLTCVLRQGDPLGLCLKHGGLASCLASSSLSVAFLLLPGSCANPQLPAWIKLCVHRGEDRCTHTRTCWSARCHRMGVLSTPSRSVLASDGSRCISQPKDSFPHRWGFYSFARRSEEKSQISPRPSYAHRPHPASVWQPMRSESHISQRCAQLPRCPFLWEGNAVGETYGSACSSRCHGYVFAAFEHVVLGARFWLAPLGPATALGAAGGCAEHPSLSSGAPSGFSCCFFSPTRV